MELAAPLAIGGAFALPALLPEAAAAGGAAAEGGLAAAGGAADLSGLTAADVSFLDPSLTAADFAGGGAAAELPAASTLASGTTDLAFGANTAGFSQSGLPLTSGGLIDTGAPGLPADIGDVAAYGPNYGATTVAGGGDFATLGPTAGSPLNLGAATGPGDLGTIGPGAPGGSPGILSSLTSGLKSAAPWLGAAGLGYNLFQGYESAQAQKALQQQETNYQNQIAAAGQASLTAAQPMLTTGQNLISGGPLPPSLQAMLDNYTNSHKAQIIQGYASRNQSTDPLQNSALQQDLAAVDNSMLALREQIGQQFISTANTLLSSGVSSTQIAAELPIMMQKLDIALQQQTGNAIANFAAAMSGGTMKVAGQGTGQNINLNLGSTTSLAA